jgi:HEPN domain-containing protein/predicted nucleotidyltransferase
MKTSIAHLPETKQKQIYRIVEVIRSIVVPEKIILYGSYAKGTYQEGNHSKDGILYEYISDFDILLILKNKELQEYEIQDKIVNTINYKAPLNVLICYIEQVNEGLEKGQYFFTEIIDTGMLLYDENTVPLSKARQLSSLERKEIAQEDFEFWFNNGLQFLLSAEVLLKDAVKNNKKPNLVAHQLHQAVEAFYGTILLVFTGYKPKIHNLDKYRKQLKNISDDVITVFPYPTTDRYELELFSLLKRAYIGGKYKKDFEISISELEELIKRVKDLKTIAKKTCLKKIASF